MGTNFWELLHQRQDQLTRSGHAVADYLLQHADEAQYLSISSLARECNVAEADSVSVLPGFGVRRLP